MIDFYIYICYICIYIYTYVCVCVCAPEPAGLGECGVEGVVQQPSWTSCNVFSSPPGPLAQRHHRGGCPLRKVDVRLPGKGDSNSHGARPVHLIITMIKWIRTRRLSIKNSLSGCPPRCALEPAGSAECGVITEAPARDGTVLGYRCLADVVSFLVFD